MIDAILSEFGNPFAATTWQVALLRMLAALVLGGVIGFEREASAKPAGLRTHMMVSLAACLFTLLTFELIELDLGSPETMRTDPIRLIEAITAGVAFLAAGTIFTAQDKVRGLTTGAGLWLAGAIGVSCGLGRIGLAALAAVLTLLVLWVLRWALVRFSPKKERRS